MQAQFVEETKLINCDAASPYCCRDLCSHREKRGFMGLQEEPHEHGIFSRPWAEYAFLRRKIMISIASSSTLYLSVFSGLLTKGQHQSIFQDLGSFILFPEIFTDIMAWANVKWFSQSCFHFWHQISKHFFTQKVSLWVDSRACVCLT